MSCSASRLAPDVIDCLQPELTISFPVGVAPGPNSVVLANGAVVDLFELGRIVSTFCPAIVCPETIVVGGAQALGFGPLDAGLVGK
jgi:hypothetical protein